MQMYNNCINQETKIKCLRQSTQQYISVSQFIQTVRSMAQYVHLFFNISARSEPSNSGIFATQPNQPNCQKLYIMKTLTISVSNKCHEAVADVSRVVHGQTNGYHQVDAGHNVDREAPQVHDTSHIHLQKGDFNCYKKNCF